MNLIEQWPCLLARIDLAIYLICFILPGMIKKTNREKMAVTEGGASCEANSGIPLFEGLFTGNGHY